VDLHTVSAIVRTVTGALVWGAANLVYLNKKRTGGRGPARFLSFWMGLPITFFIFVLVPEGEEARIRPPPDDEEALLREARRYRSLRDGSDEEP
jgi:hypothetical protein